MKCKERIVELEGKSEKRISKLEDKFKEIIQNAIQRDVEA